MTFSEFDEFEYSGPLFQQLGRDTNFVWQPGQVLEGVLGFDFAMDCHHPFLMGAHHFYVRPPGLIPTVGLRRIYARQMHRLPTFQLNLFLQAKRSIYIRRTTHKIRKHGLPVSCWKFYVQKSQQSILESLQKATATRAIVSYASPVFHTTKVLFQNIAEGTVVENSSFPDPKKLAKHKAWYYSQPGASGVANPEFERIDGEPLLGRIESLRSNYRYSVEQHDNTNSLLELSATMHNIALSTTDESRSHLYVNSLHSIEDYASGITDDEDILSIMRAYLRIESFCAAYKMHWYVIGSK